MKKACTSLHTSRQTCKDIGNNVFSNKKYVKNESILEDVFDICDFRVKL